MRLLLIGTTQVAASRTSKQDRKLGTEADLLPIARLTIGKICRISDSLKRALWKGVCVWFYDRCDRICAHMLLSYRQRYIV